MSRQAPIAVLMIRPHAFRVNEETAADNAFQSHQATDEGVAGKALAEFDLVTEQLVDKGVTVHVFDDFGERDTPDSLFPNNWISAGPGGRVMLYPMYPENRRRERRTDVVEFLKANYQVDEVLDWSSYEETGAILEGTGSIVLDEVGRQAFAARSHRTDDNLFFNWCDLYGYRPVLFDAVDANGQAIYHTNVVMGIGTSVALVGLECIPGVEERNHVRDALATTGRDFVELSQEQIANFAGNCIELMGHDGRVLAISARAVSALSDAQRSVIERHLPMLPLDIPTIELAGGSVRCLMAGVHLEPKPT